MTHIPDHLPECLVPDFDNSRWVCICNQLRACEKRVIAEAVERVEAFMYISTIGVKLSLIVPKPAIIAVIKGE